MPAHALSRAFPHQRLELAPDLGLHPWLCGGGSLGHTGEFEADDALSWGQVRRSQPAATHPLARAPQCPRVCRPPRRAFLATQAGPTPHSSGFIQEFSVQVGRVQGLKTRFDGVSFGGGAFAGWDTTHNSFGRRAGQRIRVKKKKFERHDEWHAARCPHMVR